MPKKNFASGEKARRNTNTIAHIGAAQKQEEKKQEYYRFNLKLPIEQKDYLQEMAWRSRESITAYLSDLVAADMEKHPGWRDGMDELNG